MIRPTLIFLVLIGFAISSVASAETKVAVFDMHQKMSGPILTKLRKIVGDVSKAKGYSVVLDKNENAVIFFDPAHDLTDEVIKKYDSTK